MQKNVFKKLSTEDLFKNYYMNIIQKLAYRLY